MAGRFGLAAGIQLALAGLLGLFVLDSWTRSLDLFLPTRSRPFVIDFTGLIKGAGIPGAVMGMVFLCITAYSVVALLKPRKNLKSPASSPDETLSSLGTAGLLLGVGLTFFGLAAAFHTGGVEATKPPFFGIPGDAYWGSLFPGALISAFLGFAGYIVAKTGAQLVRGCSPSSLSAKPFAFPERTALVFLTVVVFWALHLLWIYEWVASILTIPFLEVGSGKLFAFENGQALWDGFLDTWFLWPLVAIGITGALTAATIVQAFRRQGVTYALPAQAGYLFLGLSLFGSLVCFRATALMAMNEPDHPVTIACLFLLEVFWICGFGFLAAFLGFLGSVVAKGIHASRSAGCVAIRRDVKSPIASMGIYFLLLAVAVVFAVFATSWRPMQCCKALIEFPVMNGLADSSTNVIMHVLVFDEAGEIRLYIVKGRTELTKSDEIVDTLVASQHRDRPLKLIIAADKKVAFGKVSAFVRRVAVRVPVGLVKFCVLNRGFARRRGIESVPTRHMRFFAKPPQYKAFRLYIAKREGALRYILESPGTEDGMNPTRSQETSDLPALLTDPRLPPGRLLFLLRVDKNLHMEDLALVWGILIEKIPGWDFEWE